MQNKSSTLIQVGTNIPTTKSSLQSGKSVLGAERQALLQRFAERHSKMVDVNAAMEQNASTVVTPKPEFPESNKKVSNNTSSDDTSESIIWEDELSESESEEAASKSKDQSLKEKIKSEDLPTGLSSTETAKLQRRRVKLKLLN